MCLSSSFCFSQHPLSYSFFVRIGVIMVLLILIGIGTYFWGKSSAEKKAKEKFTQDMMAIDVRIDSLREKEFRLQYSLDSLKNKRKELVTVRTVYKTVYETVYLKSVPAKVVDGLNSVIATPIPEQK